MDSATAATQTSIAAPTILLVEDEVALQQMLAMQLQHHGFTVHVAEDAAAAQQAQQHRLPDVAIVDWMLPRGVSGIDLIKMWRSQARTQNLPLILLTARSAEDDRIRGLESGADDYVCKPFSAAELVARVRALMRRAKPQHSDKSHDTLLRYGDLQVDVRSHTVQWRGQSLSNLAPAEMRLLRHFMRAPEIVHSREQLLQQVWGAHVHRDGRTVDMAVRRLRAALSAAFGAQAEELIVTVWGVGYRLVLATPN